MNTVCHLRPADRARILAHLLALDGDDRLLRFGHAIRDEGIAGYVAAIDFMRDDVLALERPDGGLAAIVHVGMREREVDFGLSVDPAWRRRGLGRTLFGHVIVLARAVGAARLVCHTLNPAILRLAAERGFRRLHDSPAGALVLELEAPRARST